MFQILSFYYRNYRWLRIACAISLLLCGVFFMLLFGGFPPLAWRFLAHVIATWPVLLATRGLLVVLPFLGLVLQSFLIAALWVALMFAIIKVLWYELFQAKQHPVQEEQEEPERHETKPQVQHTPLPVQSSPFDGIS